IKWFTDRRVCENPDLPISKMRTGEYHAAAFRTLSLVNGMFVGIEIELNEFLKFFRCRARKLADLAQHPAKIVETAFYKAVALYISHFGKGDLYISQGDFPESAESQITYSCNEQAKADRNSPGKDPKKTKKKARRKILNAGLKRAFLCHLVSV